MNVFAHPKSASFNSGADGTLWLNLHSDGSNLYVNLRYLPDAVALHAATAALVAALAAKPLPEPALTEGGAL